MDIQLFATDEELQDFPENKTDSTVLDKTPNSNSINLTASDLPRSHSHLPKIPSRLPERKIKRKFRRDHRRKSRSNTRSKNPIVGRQADTAKKHTVDRQAVPSKYPSVYRQPVQARKPTVDRLAAQTNDQLDIKQRIQWVGKPRDLPRSVGHQGPPSEAALPGQPALGSPEIAPPVAHQLEARQPVLHPPVVRSIRRSHQLTFPQPVVRQPDRHIPPAVVPSSPARLGLARSNPLTPGTTVRPARYPDRPEPIKLNYQKYNNAHWTRRRSCGGARLGR